MANFTGEILPLITAEATLEGECIDAALLEALQSIPVEARASVLFPITVPVESTKKIIKVFRVPIDTLVSVTIESGLQVIPVEAKAALDPGPKTIPIEFTGTTPLTMPQFIPIEGLGGIGDPYQIPIEAGAGVQTTQGLPVEVLAGLTAGNVIPVEFTGTLAIDGKFVIPIEALGGVGLPQPIPVEAGGLIFIQSKYDIPIESIGVIVQKFLLPVEVEGEDPLSIFHVWNIFNKLSSPFLHQWVVVPIVQSFTIPHTWVVDNILGGSIDHSWRVLPDSIITFFGDDIQCPFGKVDKT